MKTVTIDAFEVMGREARTANAREMSGAGVIGKLWSEGGSQAVAVYSDYESDKDGEYNYLLGTKMREDDTLPDHLTQRRVEGGPYVQLQFEGSVTPDAVVGLWRQVWEWERDRKIERAYKTDFELYSGAGVELYVGLRSC
jgi:predicted transcriptional regulator YdeE